MHKAKQNYTQIIESRHLWGTDVSCFEDRSPLEGGETQADKLISAFFIL